MMENNNFTFPDVTRIFLKALNYPEYARPEYFIKEQEKSGWSKGVFLRSLFDAAEHYSMVLQFKAAQQERQLKNENKNPDENFGLNLEKETEGEVKAKLTKAILEDLRYSVKYAYRLNAERPTFDSYQIMAFCERMLVYIKAQFEEQVEETSSAKYIADKLRKEGQDVPVNPTYIIYTYNIISDAPVCDFHRFRNEIRKLLLNSVNASELKTILKPLQRISLEIVDLWNNKLQPIEVAKSEQDRNRYVHDRRLIDFDPEEMKIWNRNIFSPEDFHREPSTFFMNQDFASFAVRVTNFISGEILKEARKKNDHKIKETQYTDLEELFIKSHHVPLSYKILKDADLISQDNSYIGGLKSAFCIWANELRNKHIIEYVNDSTITNLLNRKFKGLDMDSSNFRTPLTKASKKYQSVFSKAITALSQASQS